MSDVDPAPFIAALEEAYRSGARVVEYADRKVEYRSLNELKRVIDELKTGEKRNVRQLRIATRRGYR